MGYKVRKAEEKDIKIIEDILLDVVLWMRNNNIENLWSEESIRWKNLSKSYKIDEFYILFDDSIPVGCMALTDLDLKYWSDIPKGESLYLHKLAVKRSYAGMGAADKLINFAKKIAHDKGINSIRLNFNKKRDKLRKLYERNEFKYVREIKVEEDYLLDLYVYNKA